MRINEVIVAELQGIKSQVGQLAPDAGHDSWQELLSRQGFSALGRGYHGQVYAHPQLDYVLKVFTTHDTAYKYWANACRGPLKGNPYVPVFRGGIVKLTADASAVRMEKLNEPTLAQMELARQIQIVLRTARMEKKNWSQLIIKSIPHIDDNLYEAVSYIQAGVANNRFMLDLRGANVMARGDHMVITDPLA